MKPENEWHHMYRRFTPDERAEMFQEAERREFLGSMRRWSRRWLGGLLRMPPKLPMPVKFGVRVGILMFVILAFLPLTPGAMPASFGGSVAINLLWVGFGRLGTLAGVLAVGGVVAGGVWMLGRVASLALVLWRTPGWDLVETRRLVIGVGGLLVAVSVGSTGVVGVFDGELLGLWELFGFGGMMLLAIGYVLQGLEFARKRAWGMG